MAHYARNSGRTVFLFDTFEGFDQADMFGIDADKPHAFADTSLNMVRQNVGDEAVRYITADLTDKRFAIVHLDCDLYEPTRAALEYFYPRLSRGGLIILHDYSSGYWDGIKHAADAFAAQASESLILLPDKSGTAMLRKSHP